MISVIIPVYNNREIKDCLEAIFKNNYPHREIIVIDNNSSDPKIKKIIQQYQVKYFLEKKLGSYHARNQGAQKAQGDILAFIDADCLIADDWFKQIEKNITKADALMGKITDINKNKIAQLESQFYKAIMENALQEKQLKRIDTRNFVIKKNIFLKYKFDQNFQYGGDMELGAHLHSKGVKIIYCPHLVIRHINETNIYKIIRKRIKQNFDNYNLTKKYPSEFIKEYFPNLIRYSEVPAKKFWKIYYLILLIINWPLMLACLYLFPKKLSYIYFKGLNVLAIRYGILKNAVQKTI